MIESVKLPRIKVRIAYKATQFFFLPGWYYYIPGDGKFYGPFGAIDALFRSLKNDYEKLPVYRVSMGPIWYYK